MSKAGRDKSNSPRIVVHPNVFKGEDKEERLKAFIDEWFVPAVVEDYIRLHRKSVVPENETDDSDVRGAKS